ncbi:hypothetical protein [Gemelliphila palaticanis]|uniref:Uncharacterized protein n=1 Tax=Gemelliphila palaticanis TaxID=81950 RepID=A0ABX2T041_9BACL|nr:hypothetical protein [Gemella palaticanis]MBF0716078.1 hypothetical protein [Gemella palaticanis]NYS48008.1 hypothetical protein [Gemella palaticanis]
MKYLVIDGNKRLSHYLDINKKHIDCIFIDFNNINESLFVSKFDFILYLFIHDIHNIHHLIHNNIIDEHDYSKFSFINNI